MAIDYKQAASAIISDYDPGNLSITVNKLKDLWMTAASTKQAGLTAADQEALNAAGVPVSVLTDIGKTIGKAAAKRIDDYLPLTCLLWDEYGREGRIVAVHILGSMELVAPDRMIPVIYNLARTCLAWEDCDQLAMVALEPIVRKKPELWLSAIEPWLADDNKWVKRAGVTVVGRLPMKHADYTPRCLDLTEKLLHDEDRDVKRAVSFAIRISARGDAAVVRDFLARHVPPENPAATWVLCDVIRSMAKQLLPAFVPLLPLYEQWGEGLSGTDRRSVDSAITLLRGVQN